jgi:hypothetical protein
MSNLIKILTIIISSILMSACSTNKDTIIDYQSLGSLQTRDYIDHLAAAAKDYLKSEDIKTIKLRADNVEFLEEIYERLVTNNQMLLNITEKPTFYIIQSKSPFLFSLPRSQFFFSSALIERYLKSEELFVAAFAAEVLRSQRYIYEKNIMIPFGFYSTEKIIQMTRLKFEIKQKVNEWTYVILKRAGYDASAYLNWIQVQNRNSLDFALFLGDPVGISKEEYAFKNFMSKQGITSVERRLSEANSSKKFYKLLNNIVSGK